MDMSARILGSDTERKLKERSSKAILKIGKDSFTRGDLASVDCYNFQAARTLSEVLEHEFGSQDTRAIFESVSPIDVALPRIGPFVIAVLGAAFEAKGIGGKHPLETWAARHFEKGEVRTFATLKHQPADGKKRRTT